jgi:hypothetical protein
MGGNAPSDPETRHRGPAGRASVASPRDRSTAAALSGSMSCDPLALPLSQRRPRAEGQRLLINGTSLRDYPAPARKTPEASATTVVSRRATAFVHRAGGVPRISVETSK